MKPGLRSLQKKIHHGVCERMARFGFAREGTRRMVRVLDGITDSVHLSYIEHEADFDVTVDIAIRVGPVEEMVNRGNALLTPKERAATSTIGCDIGNLERGERYRWSILKEVDIPAAVQAIAEKLAETGLPYFERFHDLGTVYEVLSGDDRGAWLHCPIHVERAKRACALLLVMGRENELPALVENKRSFLQNRGDPGLTGFERFVAAL
jgi:hypothetical protein